MPPKYNYSPVSTSEGGPTVRGGPASSRVRNFEVESGRPSSSSEDDELVQKRMPMCLGLCVLLAIVYVLSRTSASSLAASSSTYQTIDYSNVDMAALRAAAFARTPPHIIECAAATRNGDQSACHLPSSERYAAVKQKGATLWMTGCSGSGKTTIATKLEERLVKMHGKHVYRLDGDNIRTGLNRDLSFSAADRAESVRRVGEMATLFSDAGVITLVGLISPYREDRDAVRKRHEDQVKDGGGD